MNTFDEPNRVSPQALDFETSADGVRFTVAPQSLTVLSLVDKE